MSQLLSQQRMDEIESQIILRVLENSYLIVFLCGDFVFICLINCNS